MGIIAAKRRKYFYNFGQSFKICWNYGCSWWNAHNSLMLCGWVGKIVVPSSWEWRTPFNLPAKAVMWWKSSFHSPGKFQAHCKIFLKILHWVIPHWNSDGFMYLSNKVIYYERESRPILWSISFSWRSMISPIMLLLTSCEVYVLTPIGNLT